MVCRRRADGGRSVAGVFAYRKTAQQLTRLNELVPVIERETLSPPTTVSFGDSSTKTAAILVNGFNGLGIHTLLSVLKMFPGVFRSFVFIQAGVLDARNGIPCWNRTSLLMAVRKRFCKPPPELLGQRDDNEARSGTYSGKKRFNSGVVMTRSRNVKVPLFLAS